LFNKSPRHPDLAMRRNGSKAGQGESIRLSASMLTRDSVEQSSERVGGAAWREAGTEHEWPACDRDQTAIFFSLDSLV
jgi:hypothetical protein